MAHGRWAGLELAFWLSTEESLPLMASPPGTFYSITIAEVTVWDWQLQDPVLALTLSLSDLM